MALAEWWRWDYQSVMSMPAQRRKRLVQRKLDQEQNRNRGSNTDG